MITDNATRSARRIGARWLLSVSSLLAFAGVAAAFWAGQLSYHVVRQRSQTCNGLLAVPDSALVLVWVGVAGAAAAAVCAIVGRRLLRVRGSGVLAELVVALTVAGLIALLVALVTGAWVIAVVAAAGAVIAGGALLLLRPPPDAVPARPEPEKLAVAVLIVALLAVPVTLFLLSAVYSDVPTSGHLCSG